MRLPSTFVSIGQAIFQGEQSLQWHRSDSLELIQECTFSGNEPELVDSFSKGVFFSDQELTVWNDDKGRYEMAGTLEDAEEARNWLYGSSNFLTKQRAVRTRLHSLSHSSCKLALCQRIGFVPHRHIHSALSCKIPSER